MNIHTQAFDDKPAKVAPHNIEAEQALLGAILVNNEAHERVSSFLIPDHFFDQVHARIYEVAAKLIGAGKQATPITLRTFFESAEPISPDLTVPQYLGRLAANATTIINAADYGRTVHDLYVRRQLIIVGEDMVAQAYDSPVDAAPADQIVAVETQLYALAPKGRSDRQIITGADAAAQAIKEMNEAYQRGDGLAGISTGLSNLDEKIGGLPASNLIVVAGRPGMGKSVLAANIAQHVSGSGKKVAFFSLEMAPSQLGHRMLAAAVKGNAFKQMTGRVSEAEIAAVMAAERRINSNLTRILIDHTPGVPIATMHARARRMHRRHDLALIVVDYLQLMQGVDRPYGRADNRVQEVTQITNGLKAMANEFNLPVLALSQLNRNVENREGKRPLVSDLRESGSIEQDADSVLLLYREEYYVELEKPSPASDDYEAEYADWSQRLERCAGKAEIIVGKSRHGPGGSVELSFDAPSQTFRDLAK